MLRRAGMILKKNIGNLKLHHILLMLMIILMQFPAVRLENHACQEVMDFQRLA